MMISEMVKMFLATRKKGLYGAHGKCSPVTASTYERHLAIFTTWLLEEKSVTQYQNITRSHMYGFGDYLEEKQKKQEWAASTCFSTLRVLRTFFNWVDKDPDCQDAKLGDQRLGRHLPVIPDGQRRRDIPPNADLKKFRASFETDTVTGFRDFVITSLMAANGIRNGEVCNLKLDSLRLKDTPPMMLVDGKSGPRSVPLGKEIVQLLKAWLKRREGMTPAATSDYVFISRRSGRLNSSVLGKRFQVQCKRWGGPRVTAHTFRHAFCTSYMKNGGAIDRLKTITGHSSFQLLSDWYIDEGKSASQQANDELEKVGLLKEL